ncbi:MAG: hypothetical protein WCD47_11265 [Candidatus Sulfotelmatobacter sp.]
MPLHKRGLEWLTSHALWELARYFVGAAISAGLISVGVSRIVNAAFGTALNIFLVLMGVMGMLWMSGVVRWSRPATKEEQAKLEVFFSSPGLLVSLTPSIGRVIINLQLLTTKASELIFVHVALRNNKTTVLDCESSEPMMIEPMEVAAKMLDKKFSLQELATFEKGEMVNVDGYAKFRDGSAIRQFRITMTTIASM